MESREVLVEPGALPFDTPAGAQTETSKWMHVYIVLHRIRNEIVPSFILCRLRFLKRALRVAAS